jgi:hypothetical protein
MVHYVPLKKDFSNFDEVVALIRDPRARTEIVERAHRDLIQSGAYSYERFVADVDRDLLALGLDPAVEPAQRALIAAALRSGRLRRRFRTEANYISAGPRKAIVRRLPGAARILRVSQQAR